MQYVCQYVRMHVATSYTFIQDMMDKIIKCMYVLTTKINRYIQYTYIKYPYIW